MSKKKEEKKEEIRRQRQIQITIPGIQVLFVSEHDDETIDYLIERATSIMDKYSGK